MTKSKIKQMDNPTKSAINFITENELYKNYRINKISTNEDDEYSVVKIDCYNNYRKLSKTRKFRFVGNNHKEQLNKFINLLSQAYNLTNVERGVIYDI